MADLKQEEIQIPTIYDPHQIPGSLKIAKMHQRATEFGPSVPNQHKCPCCSKYIYKEVIF